VPAAVAATLDAPVVIVVDCSAMSGSVAAPVMVLPRSTVVGR
jgi:cobyrinic acid a,c-diamide synthase